MPYDNREVIQLLETYLAVARKHPFGHISVAMVGNPGSGLVASDFAGEIRLQSYAKEVVEDLAGKLQWSIDNCTMPERDKSLDANYVCYDVTTAPLGFDFLIWLVDAEMTRIREGAPAPLKVAFWLGQDVNNGNNPPQRRKDWVENVFRPLLGLIGAVEDNVALLGRCKVVYTPRDIVAAARSGERTPILRAPAWAVQQVKAIYEKSPITITLREAAHDYWRNSNILAWVKFADHLKKQGESVIFVRDTSYANLPLPHDHQICPTASTDLDIRMALYEHAKMNFFVSNGPGGLAIFSERPWMQFITPQKEGLDSPGFWRECNGVEIGQQWPWSRPNQRLVWCQDSFENIMQAWNSFELAEAA